MLNYTQQEIIAYITVPLTSLAFSQRSVGVETILTTSTEVVISSVSLCHAYTGCPRAPHTRRSYSRTILCLIVQPGRHRYGDVVRGSIFFHAQASHARK